MAEIVTIPDKVKTSDIPDSELNTIGKFSKKVIHHNAGAPTSADDTGLGYAVGSIWVDSTNGDTYTCTVATAEDASWINQEGDDVNVFTVYGTGSAFNYGGYPGNKETIERFSYSSPANATDSGELTTARRNCGMGQMKDKSYAYVAGGIPHGSPILNQIGRFPFASTYDEADVGEFNTERQYAAQATNGVYGWVAGGVANPGATTATDTIEKVTLASPAPASDIGEVAGNHEGMAGISDTVNSRAFYTTGLTNPGDTYLDTIEYIPFSHSSGAATDWGEATEVKKLTSTAVTPTDGWITGGVGPSESFKDKIEKYSFSSAGNASDTAELSSDLFDHAGHSSSTDGFTSGGNSDGSTTLGDIDKFSFSSPEDSADYGELTETKHACSGADGT